MLYIIRRALAKAFFQANSWTLLAAFGFYVVSCYLLLALANESELLNLGQYFYWLVVTASTVGYGDFSPTTPAGKLVTSLWVIPLGLSLFAVVITRVGVYLSEFYFRGKKGLRMTRAENHCVIIGWNGARTLRLIELLLAKTNAQSEQILLCVTADIENPLVGKIDFVRVDSFTHKESMARANLSEAKRIILDTDKDDITLTTALYCAKVSPNSHKTAYLQDESIAELLKLHCPKVEVIPSVAIEMLARSTLDPGSARVHQQLLDSTEGMTQYSITYQGDEPRNVQDLFNTFKSELSATLIAILPQNEFNIRLNPELDEIVNKGDTLYYIAARRLSHAECFR